jgi:hypothetical protein
MATTGPVSLALLPPDLKLHLLNFLPNYQHRIALARTCTDWYHHAIASAYHSIVFRCRDSHASNASGHDAKDGIPRDDSYERALAMLSPDNPGLVHIRHAKIVSSNPECDIGANPKGYRSVLDLFAYMLPKDKLLSFW